MNIWNRTKTETEIYPWSARDQGAPERKSKTRIGKRKKKKKKGCIATGVTTLP